MITYKLYKFDDEIEVAAFSDIKEMISYCAQLLEDNSILDIKNECELNTLLQEFGYEIIKEIIMTDDILPWVIGMFVVILLIAFVVVSAILGRIAALLIFFFITVLLVKVINEDS